MRVLAPLTRLSRFHITKCSQRRTLLTLAIETSCDDTSVAILEKHNDNSATLHFHSKVTSDNRLYGGVHPLVALESHQKNIAGLVKVALQSLPIDEREQGKTLVGNNGRVEGRKRPDFITVTRGPGMLSSLYTGITTAKGLAVAWEIPLLGVNHMQAHALTPRLVSALESARDDSTITKPDPEFPFLSLLVSGGHTMLVHSRSLCDHKILANTLDMAVGDVIDKCARDILPTSELEAASDVMYGRVLETFAFPDSEPDYNYSPPSSFIAPVRALQDKYDWFITPSFQNPGPGGYAAYADTFIYSSIGSSVKRIMNQRPEMEVAERRALARTAMQAAFEHLASRILLALNRSDMKSINTLVVSGGVASNQFLKAVLRSNLDAKGYSHIRMVFPPPKFCTDNAAMIAWTGIEMFEAGWRTGLEALAFRKWSIDPESKEGGILGVDGWFNVNDPEADSSHEL